MKKQCKFNIVGKEWVLKRTDNMSKDLGGLCNANTRIITIRAEYGNNMFITVLSHELAHAVAYELGLAFECNYPTDTYRVIMDHTQLDTFSSCCTVLLEILKKMR
jgi:hypothetical protein